MNPPLLDFTEDIEAANVKLRFPESQRFSQDSHWAGKLRRLSDSLISADVFSFPAGWGSWVNYVFTPMEVASLKQIEDERFEFEIQLSEEGFQEIYNQTFKRGAQ